MKPQLVSVKEFHALMSGAGLQFTLEQATKMRALMAEHWELFDPKFAQQKAQANLKSALSQAQMKQIMDRLKTIQAIATAGTT